MITGDAVEGEAEAAQAPSEVVQELQATVADLGIGQENVVVVEI